VERGKEEQKLKDKNRKRLKQQVGKQKAESGTWKAENGKEKQ